MSAMPATTRLTGADGIRRPRAMRRTVEVSICAAGMVLSLLFLGGFALVVNRTDRADLESTLVPLLFREDTSMTTDQLYEVTATLGAWFAVTLVLTLLLGAVGIFFARRRPTRKRNGWWIFAAGLVCLLGSQLIAFPIAFVFFVSAGVFALRPVTDGSPS
jgi:predicted PurR-regulated permease PerM